ncbi:hypothetical protein AaE_015518 [Aphanomyces astaci]|uniref:Uncharacterized protein n=1 Tax=Aphanomyces astaci TaxID=112090 RepID=A0A6A4Z2I6_APHAT|nr:hypothetical protein AaE_015518 [Aphanomyces astaci]
MNVAAAPSTMDPSGCPPNGRYEYLLQQVVQLNTDLHKTVALSQSLKSERDSLQELTQRLKQDVMRCEERCEKMQEVLMTETEYKVQSDRKHEALMHKWKQQLEIKAREFEVLQKNLAPPKDLDQLRLAIQDEVELPHRQRTQGLQLEIDKYREMYYSVRRDFEILKTEHDQTIINHGHEIESSIATHMVLMNDLKRQLDAADDRAADMHTTDKLRRMELDKETLVTENHKLRQELELGRCKQDCERLQGVVDEKDKKLREATDDAMRLREQVKQKDLLLVDNHNLHSSKLRELRAELEADKVQFKQKQLDWMDQIASLQLALQQSDESFQKREKEWHLEQAKQVALQSHGDTHTQHTTAALQAKLAEKTAEAATLQETLDGCTQRATHALDQEQLKVHRLQGEKDSLSAKLTTAQELIQYLEDDLVKLTDERTNDKQSFEKSQAHLQAQLDETLAASFNARRSLADEHKKVADKLTKSLVKAERKRDAYKEKCLQVHERYKAAAMAKEAAAVQLQQLKDQHHIEIQQFLTQWSHAEDSRLSGSMPGKPVVCWSLYMTWQMI